MNPTTWTRFVETGQVSDSTLYSIAWKIKQGQPISKQEQTVYQYHSQRIETILQTL